MCLSTVYKNEEDSVNICMKNVQEVKCDKESVTIVDIFGQEMKFPGYLSYANFDKGKVIVCEEQC